MLTGERRDGGLTYSHPQQHCLEEGVVVSQQLEDFLVGGDVDENREGILGYRLQTVMCVSMFLRTGRAYWDSYTQRSPLSEA